MKANNLLCQTHVDRMEALALVKEGMTFATQLYEQALHDATQILRQHVSDEAWCQMLVIVTGPASPRNGHVAMQYFEHLVGKHDVTPNERKTKRRLYYAENLTSIGLAIHSVAQLEVERSRFSSFVPMTKDILSDDAEKYLNKHCKH